MEDGKRFILKERADEEFYLNLDRQLAEQAEELSRESQGQIAYTFKMFTVNEQGEKILKCEYSASSEEERDTFYRNVEPYLQKATLLVSTIGGEIRYK